MHGRQQKKYFSYDDIQKTNGENVRDIYSKMQNVRLYFIKRFESDYIIALQEREFYNRKFRNDLQLIKDDVVVNIPRML